MRDAVPASQTVVPAARQPSPLRRRLTAFLSIPGSAAHAPARLFWTALALRLLYMTLAHTWRLRPYEDHFAFGYEAGRIARALVTGYGYADPFANAFAAHTGPTAWLPPLYPLLLAAVFRLFGVYTAASAWVVLALQCVLNATVALAVWELGRRFAGPRCARWAAWLWVFYPAALQYAVRWFWEMTLTTTLFVWLLVLTLRMGQLDNPAPPHDTPAPPLYRSWALFGLLWALIALSNSSLLLFLPVTALWILYRTRAASPLPRSLAAATLAGLIFLLAILPWSLRNQRVFHAFIPLRGNFGAELYLGNGPGANGFLMEYNHPFQSAVQLRRYAQVGEVQYVRERGQAAKAVIAADPGLFLRNTVKRAFFFWAGTPHPTDHGQLDEFLRILNFSFLSVAGLLGLALALYRRLPAAGLFAAAFLLLPLPYYAVTAHARFRHPLEPLIAILAVYLFQSASPRAGRHHIP